VRQNSPDNTAHIVCLYSKYIDRHGVEGAIKMDEEIAKSPDTQARYDKELDDIAKGCPN